MSTGDTMTTTELRSSLALALIFFLRMLGLFLILPVFVLYARDLPDATPVLIGLALGCYGLTQALCQIPFGVLSDRLGRKPVIIGGLLIFILGSGIAGSTDSIYLIILGRALQGAGAIAAAVMALAADLTRESQRSKAMALIGISVGAAFCLAFVAGPLLDPMVGVPGLFYISAALAGLAILILLLLVPDPDMSATSARNISGISVLLTDRSLLRLYVSIFLLHMILMASFVAIPLLLRDVAGIEVASHWHIYLPVLILSGILMMPFLILGEKYHKERLFFTGAVFLMLLAQSGFYLGQMSTTVIAFFLLLFFLAFNYMEASLPALISKAAPAGQKGAALGIYSTSQFIGTFCGGVAGGFLYDHFAEAGVFLFGSSICLFWLLLLFLLQKPFQHKSLSPGTP